MCSKNKFKLEITEIMIKAGLSTFLLFSAFIVPIIEQSLYHKINPPVDSILNDRSMLLKEVFSFDLLT